MAMKTIQAIDLFCGAGGLTHGLEQAGVRVVAGYDLDPACAYPYEANNKARFFERDIATLSGDELSSQWGDGLRLLAGCAPCQPFSTYMLGKQERDNSKWNLLAEFGRLVVETQPDLVSMENVPNLRKMDIFTDFLRLLETQGYSVWWKIVSCLEYGIPQKRSRLVLLASKLGVIELKPATHANAITVREAIGHLPPVTAGSPNPEDSLHIASALSPINYQRIRASKPGGSWRDWPKPLVAACHKKTTGERYGSVYGRMTWDNPAPTMTTLCYGYGNGRFGHPEQDRAITLREAAIFQTFPENYQFLPSQEAATFRNLGRLIGNAVPVRLGEVVGLSILEHLAQVDSVAAPSKRVCTVENSPRIGSFDF